LPADHALEVYSNTTIDLLPEGNGREKRLLINDAIDTIYQPMTQLTQLF